MSKNRDLILGSARELFTGRSFEQVTIKEICAHAGVANSTFYYHFKTKEELMNSLRAQDERPLGAELLDLVMTPNLLEQMLAACSMCAVRAERHGCTLTAQYYKQVISGESSGCDLSEHHAQEEKAARVLIERAQQAGLIESSIPAQSFATSAIRLTRGVIIDWCAAGGSFDLRAEVRRMLLVLFGLKED